MVLELHKALNYSQGHHFLGVSVFACVVIFAACFCNLHVLWFLQRVSVICTCFFYLHVFSYCAVCWSLTATVLQGHMELFWIPKLKFIVWHAGENKKINLIRCFLNAMVQIWCLWCIWVIQHKHLLKIEWAQGLFVFKWSDTSAQLHKHVTLGKPAEWDVSQQQPPLCSAHTHTHTWSPRPLCQSRCPANAKLKSHSSNQIKIIIITSSHLND